MKERTQKDLSTWASFKNIDVCINNKKILSDININLNYGENIVILGPNGSGKSTFLKVLNRSIYPIVSTNSSFKLFNNENINIWDLRRKVGFLFKEMEERVHSCVNLYDLIASGFSGSFNSKASQLISIKEKERIESLVNEWGLNHIISNKFKSLSDGQKRRALLARALVYQPNLLVLDEPFTNLDIKSNFILNKNLNNLIDNSVNIIYVTHNLETILRTTNRVILIKNGKILKDGNPKEIMTSRILSDLFQISIDLINENGYWRGIPNEFK